MHTIRFCSVVFGVTSNLAVIHTIYRDCVQCESAHYRSRAVEPWRRWLYRAWRLVVEYPQYTTSDIIVTTCEMMALYHRRPCWQHLACCSVNSRYIGSELRFLPTPPAFDAPVMEVPVGILLCRLAWMEKTESFNRRLNILMICLFVLTQLTNVTDRHTDTHTHRHTDTAWRRRPRLCIASRGKNEVIGDGISLPVTELLITLPSDLETSEKLPWHWPLILTCELTRLRFFFNLHNYQAESRYLQ